MAADPTSPIAPARVSLLLLPTGRITSLRFAGFVDRLRAHTTVRLGDITPDSSSASFSPLAFPNGFILYNITTALPPHSHVALSPFETFREPLVVIGICDASEYKASEVPTLGRDDGSLSLLTDIQDGMQRIRAQHSHALVLRCMLFDHSKSDNLPNLSTDVLVVDVPERPTTMKTIMADLSSLFLTELSTLARTIQTTPPLDLLYNAAHGLSTTDFPVSERAAVPFRSSSLRTEITGDGSAGGHAENGDFDSNEESISSSPALSTVTSLQNIRSTSGQDTAERLSVSGSSTFLPTEQAESNDTDLSERRIMSNHLDSHSSQVRKKKNRVSGNSPDFANSRLKARQAIIIGSLYLHAGRWPDAMRELVDGATRAKVYTDHLWHGKALENLLVTMLLLAWNGFEFQIPQICSAWSNRSTSSKRNSLITAVSFGDIRPSNDPQHNDALHNLCMAIPDLAHLIISTYARAANSQGEVPFPFSFSESVIRLARLISVLHLHGNKLDTDVLSHFVQDTPIFEDRHPRRVEDGGFKARLAVFLLKGYPTKSTALGLSVNDCVILLSGISSVFALVDMRRNQAMANKQLMALLVPVLAQAKKLRAAEAGSQTRHESNVHSKSGIENSRGELESLQQLLCQEYGVYDHTTYMSPSNDSSEQSADNECLRIPDRIVNDFVWRSLGSREMKKNILRTCADLSELMEDYQATMHYLSALFSAIRPGIKASTGTISVRQRTSREEQLDLAAQMYRVLEAAVDRGLPAPTTAYWDLFLVCSIEIQEVGILERLFVHNIMEPSPHENKSQRNGPFLHDASKKSAKDDVQSPVLIAGETADFVVTFRNLFEFEVAIESLALLTNGVVVEQKPMTMTLGPFRKQRIPVSGIPLSSGVLAIQGCKVQVRGCREQQFLIFPTPWQPLAEVKTKHNAMSILASGLTHKPVVDPILVGPMPKPISMMCNVAESQPLLKISSTSLSQSTISILQGQTIAFTITVKNISHDVSANFLHISFQHKSDPGAILKTKREPFVWRSKGLPKSIDILPGQCLTLDVEVFGIPSLSHCAIVVDYARLEQPVHEISGNIFARRVILPLTVTVNPSVDLFQFDVVPFQETGVHVCKKTESKREEYGNSILEKERNREDEGVLLLLDLRNLWLRPLSVSLRTRSNLGNSMRINATEIIQPGHIGRLLVLIPRLSWQALEIPLDPVATGGSKINPAAEEHPGAIAVRCLDHIIRELDASWQEVGREVQGNIDLSSMELSTRMLDLIRGDPVEIRSHMLGTPESGIDRMMLSRGTFTAPVGEHLTLEAEVINRTSSNLEVHIQLRPRLAMASCDDDTDVSNYLTWSGTLQRRFVMLGSQATSKLAIGLCFFAAGRYEVTVEVVDASDSVKTHGPLGASLKGTWRSTSSTSTIHITDEL